MLGPLQAKAVANRISSELKRRKIRAIRVSVRVDNDAPNFLVFLPKRYAAIVIHEIGDQKFESRLEFLDLLSVYGWITRVVETTIEAGGFLDGILDEARM